MGNPITGIAGGVADLFGGGDSAVNDPEFQKALAEGGVIVGGMIAIGGVLEAGQDDAEYLGLEY